MKNIPHEAPPFSEDAPARTNLFVSRLAIGVVQGMLLYFLLDAARNPHSAIRAVVFFPSLLVLLFIAPVIEIGAGRLSIARLALWSAILAGVVAMLGFHDAWRVVEPPFPGSLLRHTHDEHFPSAQVTFFSGAVVFMSYALILAGETAKTWFAPYETYFEFSWRLALQIWLSSIFVAVLHLVLWTGAALFMLVKLNFLHELLTESWFYLPVSAMAFAAGLHITDVRSDFIRGTRTLLLTLMSWLLPILVLIVAGFLASLPFIGLKPLWATRAAAGLLLCIAALSIVFINAVFKGGAGIESAPRLLRVSARAGCLMLPLLASFAAYALSLRIGQYGLTAHRVLACASVFVALCYALGYAWAALDRGRALQRLAPVNVQLAWVVIAVICAVLTPLADPARLAVNDQVHRLLSGRVAPERFDFQFLSSRSAVYGQRALARLAVLNEGPGAAVIREKSTQAMQAAKAAQAPRLAAAPATIPNAEALSRNLVSRTQGQAVPASFLATDWQHATIQQWLLPACLKVTSAQCDAYLADLTGDRTLNVVLIPAGNSVATVFGQNPAGQWELLGRFNVGPECAGIRDALSQASFRLLEPRLRDLEINGRRVHVESAVPQTAWCH